MKLEKVGAGRRNGYGGGVEGLETEREAALREFAEEAGLIGDPARLNFIASCWFTNQLAGGGTCVCCVEAFRYDMVKGELLRRVDKKMGKPEWFPIRRLPLHQLLPADFHWLRLALEEGPLRVEAEYTPHQADIVGYVRYQRLRYAKSA
jgi:8-oxo-dGTP pyrophosphatase MutT (NUDIX family)